MALFSRPSPERVWATVRPQGAAPDLRFQSLVTGVDNLRHDVHLSPGFITFARGYIAKLFGKHSTAAELMEHKPAPPTPQERNEFKRLAQELLLSGLSLAKAQSNPDVDLLANVALFKYLGWEVQQQYTQIVFEGKNKLKKYEGPRYERDLRALQLKQTLSEFQANKKIWLRRVGGELLMLTNEVQADVVRKTRESFFGAEAGPWFFYFSNPLAFTENGRDDYIHLAKYVMIGNFARDPDLYELVVRWLKSMLQWVDQAGPEAKELEARRQEHARATQELEALRAQANPAEKGTFGRLFGGKQEAPPPPADLSRWIEQAEQAATQIEQQVQILAEAYDERLGRFLNVPENVEELFGAARTEQALNEARGRRAPREETAGLEEKLEIQRYLAEEFYNSAQQRGLLPRVAAAYEAARIHQDYCPPINPQQLKHALLDQGERKKVADLVGHYKLANVSAATLEQSAAAVRGAAPRELRAMLFRFIADFMRHHRDARLLAVLQGLEEQVNLMFDEKTSELSRINNTLYEFLLPSEQRPQERRVLGHVILKADVRDSTKVTAELYARGLNPASHFSLNFFDPLNKLFTRYDVTKVFIEGDAVILAAFETENAAMGGYPMARTCGLAREMMEVVNAYNARAEKTSLPRLDIGIGICWQDSSPMYLLDGETRIMISPAINLADRLSGCSKLARRAFDSDKSPFNVYVFQTITDEQAGGAIEEFLVRFNTGVCLSPEAFNKLQQEISLRAIETEIALLWKPERVRLYTGSFPMTRDVFQRLVVREARIPFIEAHDFSLKHYTERFYYELCTNRSIYEFAERTTARGAGK
jgi:hypothetical protein